MEERVSIHFSVDDGIIEVEQKKGPLISRKEISRDQLLNCFRKSVYIREDAPPVLSSGFLPLNTLAVRQTKESVSVVVWYPRLRADLSLYKTPYPDFPIPRLVFGFSVGAADGAVSACRIGVIADETPTPDTTRIAPGVLLSDAQITTQNKGGVVLYILESYQIVGSPEENAA